MSATYSPGRPFQSLEAAGRDAAGRLYREGRRAKGIEDPRDPLFARAALDELQRLLQDELPGLLRDIIEGAGRGAHDLNVRPEHGLVEVIQNADDSGATDVTM